MKLSPGRVRFSEGGNLRPGFQKDLREGGRTRWETFQERIGNSS
jgi:hypothetical protein